VTWRALLSVRHILVYSLVRMQCCCTFGQQLAGPIWEMPLWSLRWLINVYM
jgi:hypothetical protein